MKDAISEAGSKDILTKAMDLFKREGIHKISVEALVDRLNITMEAFASIAGSKEDFLKLCILNENENQRARQKHIMQTSDNAVHEIITSLKTSISDVRDLNPQYFADLSGVPELWNIVMNEMQNFSLPAQKELLNRGVQQGVFRSDINIDIVSKVVVEMVNILLNYKTFPPERYPMSELIRSIYLYYFRGLCRAEQAYLVDKYFTE
jgi:AcrR family transcriptional regulator